VPVGAADEAEAEAEYPKSWRLLLISIALCLAVFCVALDNTIIATALPKITDTFEALDDVGTFHPKLIQSLMRLSGWYISVYLLCTCSLQLIFGKLYTFYSIKIVFLTALAIFEIGSLICALSPTSMALIWGRAIAGMGSSGLFSGAILIVSYTVPLAKRPMYTGLIGATYGVASVAGPLLGGAFTDNPHLTWRWCFYINLPFGAIAALFIVVFFSNPKRHTQQNMTLKEQLDRMDLPGTSVFLPGVVCLLLALQWGGSKYPWSNGRIIALLVVSVLLLTTFVVLQVVRGEKATVSPRVFKNRSIFGSALFAFCIGGAFFVVLFYVRYQSYRTTDANEC
jgi:MFS family permease